MPSMTTVWPATKIAPVHDRIPRRSCAFPKWVEALALSTARPIIAATSAVRPGLVPGSLAEVPQWWASSAWEWRHVVAARVLQETAGLLIA
jgi:hypothetical protein